MQSLGEEGGGTIRPGSVFYICQVRLGILLKYILFFPLIVFLFVPNSEQSWESDLLLQRHGAHARRQVRGEERQDRGQYCHGYYLSSDCSLGCRLQCFVSCTLCHHFGQVIACTRVLIWHNSTRCHMGVRMSQPIFCWAWWYVKYINMFFFRFRVYLFLFTSNVTNEMTTIKQKTGTHKYLLCRKHYFR